ncbi:alpha/beta fold hydrolase [Actinophytocola sp.]|uniref:alpha/beta fold hydrolase n=1 Tax=Actinophytocola sp. TaxID=1872138 RepID=UPI003D6A0FE7
MPDAEDDEWGSLVEAAGELGLGSDAVPRVVRRHVVVDGGRRVSIVRWGEAPPEVVFLHGAGQNARTWDLVALALGRPALALDLPGHGRSDWRDDHDYSPARNAEAVAIALTAPFDGMLEPVGPLPLVGMSLGGLTGLRLTVSHPDLVRHLTVVDITPGGLSRLTAMSREQRCTVALTDGAEYFDSLEDMVEHAVLASPRRSANAVRRGVGHNALRLPDGWWRWRHDITGLRTSRLTDRTPLWADVSALRVPVLLVRGGDSPFVADGDVAAFRQRCPAVRVEVVPGAGHAVQSDRPRELATLIDELVLGDR